MIIEPGRKPEDVETWFSLMAEKNMTVARIRMLGSYMRDTGGNWDFSLFTPAFEAAKRHGVRILGTLFPATGFDDVGGFKFPETENHFKELEENVRQAVSHFKQYEALGGWVLQNEPNSQRIPDSQFSRDRFAAWCEEQDETGLASLDFREEKFLQEYTAWFLNPWAHQPTPAGTLNT